MMPMIVTVMVVMVLTIMIVSYNNVNGEHIVDYDDHGDDSGDDDGCVPRVTQGRPRNLPQGQKR